MDSKETHRNSHEDHRPTRLGRFGHFFRRKAHHREVLHVSTRIFAKLPVLDVGISTGSRGEFFCEFDRLSNHHKSAYVCFVNVHMLMEAQQNHEFRGIVNAADVACPDGLPVAQSVAWIYALRQSQIAGPDTLPDLMNLAHLSGKRIFVLGSTPDVLAAFQKRAEADYGPELVVGTASPPFRTLSPEEDQALVDRINATKADMIFVALGCPKQEKWMHAHRGKVHGCMYGLGYAIPVYAGIESRAPRWMIERGLEWAFRLSSNPRRLLKRYVRTNSAFLLQLVRAKFWHRVELDRGDY